MYGVFTLWRYVGLERSSSGGTPTTIPVPIHSELWVTLPCLGYDHQTGEETRQSRCVYLQRPSFLKEGAVRTTIDRAGGPSEYSYVAKWRMGWRLLPPIGNRPHSLPGGKDANESRVLRFGAAVIGPDYKL
jgi:hypothetical protein